MYSRPIQRKSINGLLVEFSRDTIVIGNKIRRFLCAHLALKSRRSSFPKEPNVLAEAYLGLWMLVSISMDAIFDTLRLGG